MNDSIFFDAPLSDEQRRELLYDGQLFVYSATPSSRALTQFAAELAEAAFAPLDPAQAQHSLPVEQFAAILSELKPKFIHHHRSKELIRGILQELGCDLQKTYFDVPRMRTATAEGFLTTGIAFAFHPHRDTWYSAPMCQLNWWLPIYPIERGNGMAFHARYWKQPVKNGSATYNYQEWVRTSRFIASQQIAKDTRKQPTPEEPVELDPQVRVVTPVGGLTIFSAAHLHSSVPNQTHSTRFSIDFRTVHLDDVVARRGAPNIDSACTGTTLGDFLQATDFANLPDDVIASYM
jgi:hypothetical protein